MSVSRTRCHSFLSVTCTQTFPVRLQSVTLNEQKMPYRLQASRSRGRKGYFVVSTRTGKRHSLSPLPRSRAEAQMRALYAVENGYILNRPSRRRRMRGGELSAGRSRSPSRQRSRSRQRSPSRLPNPQRWVKGVVGSLKHEGSLSRKAQRLHKSTHTFACEVLRSPTRYTLQTQRQAQFFVNINKHNKC